METTNTLGRLPMKGLLLLPLAMLALCVAGGAELELALAGWLAGRDPASSVLWLASLTLGVLGLTPLCAFALLLGAHWRRHGTAGRGRDFLTREGTS